MAAAQQELQEAMRCKWTSDLERGIRKVLDKPASVNRTATDLAKEEQKLRRLQDNLERVDAARQICDRTNDIELDKSVYDDLLKAARLGDKDAASCYIVAPFDAPGLQSDPSALAEYKRNATDLIENGVLHGDWVMIDILEGGSRSTRGNKGWFNNLLVHDDLSSYKYKRLLRLGAADEDFAAEMDQEIGLLKTKLERAGIDTVEIRAADLWAEQMYRQYFADKPLMGRPSACVDPYRGANY